MTINSETAFTRFVPISSFPNAKLPPGVLIFRFEESLTYPNAGHLNKKIKNYVMDKTPYFGIHKSPEERLWSDDTEEIAKKRQKFLHNRTNTQYLKGTLPNGIHRDTQASDIDESNIPTFNEQVWLANRLKWVIFDFSSVSIVDSSGFQMLHGKKRNNVNCSLILNKY